MLLPCTDNLLRNVSLDRPSHRIGRFDSLPRDIELALLEIVEMEINLMRRQDSLKNDLEIRYDFSTLSAFRSVDKYNDGRIDNNNLGAFLRSCGTYPTETELLAIIRRIDTDGDAKLDYAEFAEFLRTACPPSRTVQEEAALAERAKSAERYRRSQLQGSGSSPLRAHSPPRNTRSPGRQSPLRASSPEQPRQQPRYPSPMRKPLLPRPDEDELVQSLRDIMAIENEIEGQKSSIATKSDFNLTDAFAIFDQDHRGSVSVLDLRDGLSAIGVFPTSEELDLFVSRYDSTGDRRINVREFSPAFLA